MERKTVNCGVTYCGWPIAMQQLEIKSPPFLVKIDGEFWHLGGIRN